MNKITVTLIGGHNDGRQVEVDPSKRKIRSGYLPEPKWFFPDDPEPVPVFTQGEMHEARSFQSDGKIFDIWVLEGMTDTEALEKLIRHYDPIRKP